MRLWKYIISAIVVATVPATVSASPLQVGEIVVVDASGGIAMPTSIELLREEVAKRTGITMPLAAEPLPGKPALILETADTSQPPSGLEIPDTGEGFAIWLGGPEDAPQLHIAGNDGRGIMFGIGMLLRNLHMAKNTMEIDSGFRIAAAPAYPIRGHQLGYRDTANSYDAWDIDDFEQYIRDLIVFGTNSIELIPPNSEDAHDSPLMKTSMWDMTLALCDLLDSYDLDVWMWVPVEGDVTDKAQADEQLERRAQMFSACSRIDGIFVPGGDPGHTEPAVLMPFLERFAAVLHESHPDAGLWVSNQGFTPEQNDVFFAHLQDQQPDWLAGVVFGPWAKVSIEEVRRRTPKKYGVRQYPDICHSVRCQYPVPAWDPAFARTLGREPFNPRPLAMARIQNLYGPSSVGTISYSDGITDDVNKIVWTTQEWEDGLTVDHVLAQYGNYFFGSDVAPSVAAGLNAFETNWEGPLLTRNGIEQALVRWQTIDEQVSATAPSKWRLKLCLLRAAYDAYVQRRLLFETDQEKRAYLALAEAEATGATAAIAKARECLAEAASQPENLLVLRERLVALGKELNDLIGLQLDVANYKARNSERGAVLEFLDEPLNDRVWLNEQFDAIAMLTSEKAKIDAIDAIVHWEDPSNGALYDDLGNASKQPHLFSQKAWRDDPGRIASAGVEFSKGSGGRLSWADQTQTLFGTPLRMKYTELDPLATYRFRVTYAGRYRATMRLTANGTTEIHGPLKQPDPVGPVEFPLDRKLTQGGSLELEWNLVDGRGCQVAEVWLIRD